MDRVAAHAVAGAHHHVPALDGLRGLAVAGVVAFHAEWSWAGGGFLGVSTFFTLSGFLITSLLLRERAESGRVDLMAFWTRRARRLLPAATTTLLAVAVLAPVMATADQLAALRGDVVAALLYVANWRFLVDDRSYADLFAAPSPVLHFWSLAIEEQLYVVLPVLVVVARRRLALVLAALAVASVLIGAATEAYYGTHVRAAELLVGALLAVLVARRRQMWRRGAARTVGVVGLSGMLWAWSTATLGGAGLYRGGLALHAVASACVVLACVDDAGGPVARLLSLAPLRGLGRISYGVYLVHWPVFVWSDWPVVAELLLTLLLAIASFVVVEQPVRARRVRVPLSLVPASAVLVVCAVMASTLDAPRSGSFELAASSPVVPAEPSAPRVAMFGDSTALRTGFALRGYGWTTGRLDMRDGGADVGCPLVRGGTVDFVVAEVPPEPHCDGWPRRWRALAGGLDVAVVQVGPWDVTDRRIDGERTHIGEPRFDRLVETAMHEAVDVLSADGALVVWLTAPHIEFGRGQPGIDDHHPINDPRRVDRLNEVLAAVDLARDELVVLDLAGHLRSLPGGEMDPTLRPDGVHFSEDGSAAIAEWLASRLIDLASRA